MDIGSKKVSNLDSIINAILLSANKQKVEITKYKIDKLLYFVCGYWIGFFDEWLLDAAQNFQAQENGPVLEALHAKNNIEGESIPLPRTEPIPIPTSLQCVIDEVVGKYGNCSSAQLREETHDEPWEKAHARGENADIDRNDMKNYFKKELNAPSKVEVIHDLGDKDHTEAIKIAESLGIWK